MWGETRAHKEDYEFATQAELDAFRLGISEMDGWMGYLEVTDLADEGLCQCKDCKEILEIDDAIEVGKKHICEECKKKQNA